MWQTHISVLSVDASNKIGETMPFLIFVWNEKSVRVEIAMVYLETSLVGNPVAISEGRGTRKVIAGHIMESVRRKGKSEIE